MICKYCGRTISDGSTTCPYCGSSASLYSEPVDDADDTIVDSQYKDLEEDFVPARKSRSKASLNIPKVSMPKVSAQGLKMPSLNLTAIFSLICALFSLVCLLRVNALTKDIAAYSSETKAGMNQISSRVADINDKLSMLDTTIANVQTDAYNQYASQAITISKDLTSLTGPVDAGKYNQMFIINAKGNLSLSTSFDWQKYDDFSKTWVSIEFTGTATSNEEYGLRIENTYNKDTVTYVSVLWANGITPSAAGTYRCVITDINGLTNTSSEAVVSVKQA